MKVFHIESGLGNQMLSYSELLLSQKLNPKEKEYYVETIIYEIPECNEVIKQWYGYELADIFDINTPNIKTLFTDIQWERIIGRIRKSEFWKTWNYPEVFVDALNSEGLNLKNYRGSVNIIQRNSLKKRMTNNRVGYSLKRIMRPLYQDRYIDSMSCKEKMHIVTDEDIFTGQWLGLMRKQSGIELVENEIRQCFEFPKFTEEKNQEILERIQNCNSIAIHARRGDALGTNGYCYKYGYFKRALKYIKKNVNDPEFYFFTDPGSMEWINDNIDIFGLNKKKNKIQFVTWNTGKNSFRDMQLMSSCKHNVITFSSFGWWGAFLNKNINKITCSPSVWINTTRHF